MGVCEKGEWLDDISKGDVIYTTKGKEYNILEDRSDCKEVKKYSVYTKARKVLLAIIILAVIIFIFIND